jgi:Nuclease-related domain
MNTEEARKVLWLKNNHRPIGELLDGGYLTQDRLEWAAKKAYDPNLQQAAKILLETSKPGEKKVEINDKPIKSDKTSISIGISLDKARATIWPYKPYKGQPMGTLVEAKQLSLKDLIYAVENVWDERIRQAAIALSLMRLEQVVKEPTPSAGFTHLISGGRSYAERKQLFLMMIEGLVLGFFFGAMLLIAAFGLVIGTRPNPNAKSLGDIVSTPIGIIVIAVVLGIFILLGLLVNIIPQQLINRLDKQIEEYRRGQEGEDHVVELIIQALDGNWHLFRNIDLPGRNRGDLDLVLVGPPGVWVLEVKNFRGKYRNIGESWEYLRGKKWKTASSNPSRQSFKNALRLANFLKADGLNVFVNAAVIWANEESPLFVENPSVAVWTYNRLADELGNIWQGEKVTQSERKKITDKLSKLCERATKAHQLSAEEQRN